MKPHNQFALIGFAFGEASAEVARRGYRFFRYDAAGTEAVR